MFNVERICNNISHKIGNELNYDKKKIAVINYGLFAFIHTLFSILLIVIGGKIFGVLTESLIIAFTASILRKYSGGVHASTPRKCAFFGAILSVGMARVIRKINVSYRMVALLGVIAFIISFYLVYKLAPVDSSSKPIKKEESIKRLKRGSILILTFYLIVIILGLMSYLSSGEIKILIYSLCLYGGMLWQVFSLTQSGHKFIYRVDALF